MNAVFDVQLLAQECVVHISGLWRALLLADSSALGTVIQDAAGMIPAWTLSFLFTLDKNKLSL